MGVLPASYGLTDQPEVAPDAPLFLVRRAMDASITDEDLEALTFRSAGYLSGFADLRWERSFWDAERKESACLYRAPSPDILRQHAELARISCDSIEQVVEAHPRDWEDVYDAYRVPKYWESEAR